MRILANQFARQVGTATPASSVSELSPVIRSLLDRMARCIHMIDLHGEGITLNMRRLAELQAELESIEVRR